MVTIQDATSIISQHLFAPVPEAVLITDASGRVLSERILAERDFPPFDRVSMDGIAISYDEWQRGRRQFKVEDVQAAGEAQKILDDPAHAMEVMTGAVLPEGTDTVIRYEDLEIIEGVAHVRIAEVEKGQSIHPLGQDARKGDILIHPPKIITPAEVALLATNGLSRVDVLTCPRAAIVSSGDELIDIDETPEPYQIRKSNSYAIQAAMKEMRWNATPFHLPDNKDFQIDSLRTILDSHDVVILTGGVSKGKFDYIPEVLSHIGVEQKFHRVSQRPGKPFWFGVYKKKKAVFALPGNPVSTFMCFYRYVKPWFLSSMGIPQPDIVAILAEDVTFKADLTYFLQVQIVNEGGKLMAYPQAGGGSGDFANLEHTDAFMELPREKTLFKAGEVYPIIPFR